MFDRRWLAFILDHDHDHDHDDHLLKRA